ncbi:hypothetical protein LEP1GSC060_3376 [Leptospira weilii serovar Ranarum str. ICFT]|uniref:Uncharacterized protein n=1 Tax=Leptospira weilii serovar Ranarum str. ICFT TaxID=1218598 RepID=N1WDA6_9LEPT|nr:hypothetical protein LEP1GSC060_3376 [Leptospira weilii serovar Ranarum str. ICFT]
MCFSFPLGFGGGGFTHSYSKTPPYGAALKKKSKYSVKLEYSNFRIILFLKY